jgi:hypothetical protein
LCSIIIIIKTIEYPKIKDIVRCLRVRLVTGPPP